MLQSALLVFHQMSKFKIYSQLILKESNYGTLKTLIFTLIFSLKVFYIFSATERCLYFFCMNRFT